MIQIAVVYHSETGNTRRMAEIVKQGCESVDGVEARCFSIEEVDAGYLGRAQAVILGCVQKPPRRDGVGPNGVQTARGHLSEIALDQIGSVVFTTGCVRLEHPVGDAFDAELLIADK